jgi:hypothetical protein
VLLMSHHEHIPHVLKSATNSIGKPLTLDTVRLMLDRTLNWRRYVLKSVSIGRHGMILWLSSVLLTLEQKTVHIPAPRSAILTSKLRHMLPGLEALGRGLCMNSCYRTWKIADHRRVERMSWKQLVGKDSGINRNTYVRKSATITLPYLRRSMLWLL